MRASGVTEDLTYTNLGAGHQCLHYQASFSFSFSLTVVQGRELCPLDITSCSQNYSDLLSLKVPLSLSLVVSGRYYCTVTTHRQRLHPRATTGVFGVSVEEIIGQLAMFSPCRTF